MIVRVAIDLALDRFFDYEVPEALKEKLVVGQLLSVPFGHREARGFAMEFRDAPERPDCALKPVKAIVDETPFFSGSLLELVRKVANYTMSPIESVLKAALPAAVLKKNARPRELLFIEPSVPMAELKITKRQQWLFDQIVRLNGGWLSQLCTELKTTPATIKELGRLGLVKVAVRAKRRNPLGNKRILASKPLTLNEEQQSALATICGDDRRPMLLFGVTGSGKTEVYLQAIAAELAAGRGAIVMVPEIALTPQTVQRFASRFGDRVAVLHSALSDGERYDEWHRIRSGKAVVVVGPRSAVWAPVSRLGLIVVDEEHEPSYKQDESPRYHARDVAVLRGMIEGCKVVLGSATPSLESWMNVRRGKYAIATIRHRAGAGTLPRVGLVMMSGGSANDRGIFSRELLEAIKCRLDRHEQTILFLNRRGYSRSVVCEKCGHVISCPNCSIDDQPMPYTYHRADSCLRCHVCGGWIELPSVCPECKTAALQYRGIGTQRAEDALKKCFPYAAVLRMDADSTSRKFSHDDILRAFGNQEADILIGTQMIAKGLDFPNVTLVGVLNADSSLNMPDFRAAERTFQLLSQVAGRAGRAERAGEVIIQTFDDANQVLRLVANKGGDYEAFAENELKIRGECGFPPFCHLAAINFKSQNLSEISAWAELYSRSLHRYAERIAAMRKVKLSVGEPVPSAFEKADGWFHWRLILRAERSSAIINAWRWIYGERPPPKTLRVAIDMDALNLV